MLPIRPSQEWRALEWLSSDEIEGAQGLSDPYRASGEEKSAMLARLQAETWQDPALAQRYANLAADGLTRLDAIRHLILSVQDQQRAERELISPAGQPEQKMLPTDRVFETGFDPLQGGFEFRSQEHFAVFDQWVEIPPTDQIVPVEVAYNPKTGRQEGQ